ncbi:MAG: hypothetical protein OEU95_07125, partial [Nitrospirota bacterium]|nr:hypothetical protein [Nitrospirota bacterium]
PIIEVRFRAAEEIRREAIKCHDDRYAISALESAMGRVNQNRLRTILFGIACQLTPEVVEKQKEDQD